MTPEARIASSADILDDILSGTIAERALTAWARRSRFAGSGDRAAIRDLVFDALRRQRSAAARGGGLTGRGLMIGLLREAGRDPAEVFTGNGHAPAPLTETELTARRDPLAGAEAVDLPDWLQPAFEQAFGPDWSVVAEALRHRAPVWLRINGRKGTRSDAIAALSDDGVETRASDACDTALEVTANPRRVAQSRAYREGLVELQDLSSQQVAASLPMTPGARILDYCCGGGGKTLAMAGLCDATFLCHDADAGRMADLPERAARAGIAPEIVDTAGLASAAPFDLVLCDAPCSGSGSWRRDPEGKWALTAERLDALQALQDRILDDAAGLVGEGGVLAYATCSLLAAENEARADAFVTRNAGWRETHRQRFDPRSGGDGFFVATFERA